MEIDMNINDVLQEMITFLECLREVQLPLILESLREKLLVRSKNTLSVAMMARPSSPEPYLNMKSGPRSLLLTKNENDLEEYIGMEESPKKDDISKSHSRVHQDYETFENKSQDANESDRNNDRDEGEKLIGIYKNLSATQIKSKCYKCGLLYKKEGKKLFLSESRACWIALVGSHLLIYRSERHNRPYAIYSIRGYRARPAPTLSFRDRRKSESAFEIYSPGNETLQFVARSPKDMDQWITKISEMGCNHIESEDQKQGYHVESTLSCLEISDKATRHQEPSPINGSAAKIESINNKTNNLVERKDTGGREKEKAPPLPARIPRRLPSLPPVISYKPVEADDNDDDDDDIYHRIEDLKNETRYQNMILSKKQQANVSDEKQEEVVAYDDIHGAPGDKIIGKLQESAKSQEMYDDIVTFPRGDGTSSVELEQGCSNDTPIAEAKEREEFYDDVESLIPNRKLAKDRAKDEAKVSNKFEKKSFLDRVLSRRESSGKFDKTRRCKGKAFPSNSSFDTKEMPTYDDVSDLTSNLNQELLTDGEEELPEYNCPPPPRPVYEVKSAASSSEEIEEFYDDVNAFQRHNKDYSNDDVHDSTNNTESEANDDCIKEESEHYQSPRSDSRVCDVTIEQNEELYDDIALWADFTARQKDIKRTGSEDGKSVNLDKKAWNRFANRKSRITSDFNCETNKRGNNSADEVEDTFEGNGPVKRNTFQKLISKMENSLAKVSARNPSPMNKPSVSNSS